MAKMTPDEYDKWILELAIHARNFMRQSGAYLEPEEQNESNHGYVTVDEVCEVLDVTHRQWQDIKRKLLAMGEPITMDDFGGHFLGKPGSQAKNPAMLITRAITMMETATLQITALQGIGDWKECKKYLEELMDNNRHKFAIADIPKLLSSAKLKSDPYFEKRLLQSELTYEDDGKE